MFDLGLSKMMLIGVVALIVIGPERLPRVARTVGALLGRAQRYINDVKADVAREIEFNELRRMKAEFDVAAHHAKNTIYNHVDRYEAELNQAWQGDAFLAAAHADGAASLGSNAPERAVGTAENTGGAAGRVSGAVFLRRKN